MAYKIIILILLLEIQEQLRYLMAYSTRRTLD